MMRVNELSFTDVFLGDSVCWFSGIGGADESQLAGDNVMGDLMKLRGICEKTELDLQRPEFTVRYDTVSYRVSAMESIMEKVFVLRRFPDSVPDFQTLGIMDGIRECLLKPKMTGLIIIAGAYGQGKTTTASSLVCERLNRYGGVAITLEDPPEMPLQGARGSGVCYQTWVEDGNFSAAARKAARWAPTIIFLGEVRDGHTADEALKASINGRLVICTLHADSVQSALERMYSLASSVGGATDDSASLLSNGLAAVMFQKLEGDKKKRICTEFLFLRGDDPTAVKNLIRQRKFIQVGSEINLQANQLLSKKM